jgi:UPF0716 family protein affecting phage T7 exclusion
MDIAFTSYLWVNWAILSLTIGAFWTLGCWVMSALLGALVRKPTA